MAGTFGAIFCKTLILSPPIYKSTTSRNSFLPSPLSIFRISKKPSTLNPVGSTMAAQQENTTAADIEVEVKEPALKVQKLDQNGDGAVTATVQSIADTLRVKKLSEKAVLPTRGSSLSAGYDLSSAVEIKVPARGKALVDTDLSIAIPEGTYARIAPRSGLAWKNAIDVGAGVIDADYRGPVKVILFNHSDEEFEVKHGERIAQLILEKIVTPEVVEVEDLEATVRGAGGFGSTGV